MGSPLDIRLDAGFFRHVKTKRLEHFLGPRGLICLQKLWVWAAEHAPDGSLRTLSIHEIEAAAEWRGGSGKFASAIIQAGFVERSETDGTLAPHDWQTHQPFVSGRSLRAEASRKAARARWEKEKGQNVTESGAMRHASAPHMPPSLPSPSIPSPSREEERTPPPPPQPPLVPGVHPADLSWDVVEQLLFARSAPGHHVRALRELASIHGTLLVREALEQIERREAEVGRPFRNLPEKVAEEISDRARASAIAGNGHGVSSEDAKAKRLAEIDAIVKHGLPGKPAKPEAEEVNDTPF